MFFKKITIYEQDVVVVGMYSFHFHKKKFTQLL